mmetsp:Transcript_13392/g.19628  ORF Transcript_13392/g.19628 Transcript_13392/m.19628 type:complete len:141 (+) Transcript_13392:136-558(+)
MAAVAETKKQPVGLSGAVKLVVRTFLEQKHYRSLLRTLANSWGGSHALSAAVRLMEAHGVKVSPDEEQRLSQMSEERMIDTLVMRMPQQSREQFDHFFLQLSPLYCISPTDKVARKQGFCLTTKHAGKRFARFVLGIARK